MNFRLFSAADVEKIHDLVLNPGEPPGKAKDKSLEGALSRVESRISYGMISDIYDLAAAYGLVIATGHVFNDANKRTAARVLDLCLHFQGIDAPWQPDDLGDKIREVAQGQVDEGELADWLRVYSRRMDLSE